jgi:hypothetical protein
LRRNKLKPHLSESPRQGKAVDVLTSFYGRLEGKL